MFSEILQVIVLFFLGVIILMPTYIKMTKDRMYDEWKKIWKSEIEAEKRMLAMQEIKMNNVHSGRKQK